MIKFKIIENIVHNSVKKILKSKFDKIENLENFIGIESEYESIEIIQILSLIEEEIEDKGFQNYDLLEIVANYETLTLEELIRVILSRNDPKTTK